MKLFLISILFISSFSLFAKEETEQEQIEKLEQSCIAYGELYEKGLKQRALGISLEAVLKKNSNLTAKKFFIEVYDIYLPEGELFSEFREKQIKKIKESKTLECLKEAYGMR